jgi:uncharacterized protein YjbI with pentapeptide repeats
LSFWPNAALVSAEIRDNKQHWSAKGAFPLAFGVVFPLLVKAAAVPLAMAAPANSCLAVAQAVDGGDMAWPTAVDGRTLKRAADIAALRKNAKDGRAIVVDGGDFSGQSFSGNGFSNICFKGTKLARTKWTGAKASGIGFINTDLTGARMERAQMDHVLFRSASLTQANARRARFAYGQLDGGWDGSVAGLNLDGANLTGFRFACGSNATDGCGFDRKKINLAGADLSGASLYLFSMWEPALDGVTLNKTEIGLDHIGQFSVTKITGPILVRAGDQTVAFDVSGFDALRAALISVGAAPTNCAGNNTPLRQLICDEPSGELSHMERENMRLYTSVVPDAVVISGAQEDYLADLDACATQPEEAARTCLKVEFDARRAALINQLVATKRVELGARALFVRDDVPHLRMAVAHPDVRKLAPVLAAASSAYLLLRIDEDGNESAIAVGTDPAGKRCTASHIRGAARRSAPPRGLTTRTWLTGADFTTIAPRTANGLSYENPCPGKMPSGPLVRIPIEPKDFERLVAGIK